MGRIGNTIELAKSSWRVIQADKELLLLPVLSMVSSLVVAATFILPLLASVDIDSPNALGIGGYMLLFAMYVVLAFVTIFFNAALIHAADERLDGGDPTLGSAIAGAWSRAGRILPWAIVSATVSVILQAIEERAGALGRIIAGVAGLAWSLVTFLVLPILVIEGVSVGEAIRGSSSMFKRTWGENVTARVGFGLLGVIAALPGVALVALAATAGGGLLAIGIVLGVLWMLTVGVVVTALSGVFQTALYRYASTGMSSTYFPATGLSSAFQPRRR